ncbi:O-Antigen ligase [Singulisphaera sp. GP187]|uniref:O-antigen ligase family protein n=1 Tax=Singulisphaera sp. GP187 TaxID=1882752 RepID=UPI000928D0AB|nr:O-antigen ligase family protein [Singulisphaera sp. GP187]SIO61453.1 O-Antigen ligase [Singulisphaera sp. GP187]
MDFAAFVLLNAVLFIRPMEFIPAFYGLPLYNMAFCLCLFLSLPALLGKGVLRTIVFHPIGVCVLTLASTAVLSNLANGGIQDAADAFDVMSKVFLYYILLVVVVRTPARLKWFLAAMVINGCVVAGVGIADYKGIIRIPSLIVVEEMRYANGQAIPFRRLGSTGLFADPNDLGLFLVGCMINSLYLASDRSVALPLRALWLLPLGVLFMALLLTYSRAGMLTLLVALAIYGIARYGWRALLPMALALPVVLGVGGRQMEFKLSGGTGQTRVVIWDCFFSLFVQNPVLGVGYNHCLDYADQVAHNSYLHAFAELGYVGGTSFLGAVLLGLYALLRIGPLRTGRLDPALAKLWPFLLAGIGCFAFGIMSLSRCYVTPTYSILGLVAAYERMALAVSPRRPLRLGPTMIGLLLLSGVAFLLIMFVIIKKNANY